MLEISTIFKTARKYGVITDNLMHLGANYAQSRSKYIENGTRKLLWVEAIPEIADHLKNTIGKFDTVFQAVLYSETGKRVKFNIADNACMSSSIYEFNTHKHYYPQINFTKSIELETITLDSLLRLNNVNDKYEIAILDLQGSELEVFKGATLTLSNLRLIACEVSQEELYFKCALENEIDDFLFSKGFIKECAAYTGKGWGEALYIKK